MRNPFVGRAPKPDLAFTVTIPPEMAEAMTFGGRIAPPISRAEALQVPAVLRARNIICSTLAALPVRFKDAQRRDASPTTLLDQIDADIANVVVLSDTYEDLFFEGTSWWRITQFGWHGFPTFAEHLPHSSVYITSGSQLPSADRISPDIPFPSNGQVYVDGRPVRDEEIIRFDSPNPPFLRYAARAIRACLQLGITSAMYAQQPLPLGYFSPKENVEPLTPEEVQELLNKWESARQLSAWGYVSAGLDAKVLQWSPEQMQLESARQTAVLEIARAAGIDPEDLGVSTTSRTYQNSEQRRQDLIDFTLGPYMHAVEQRLSMRDVIPRGYYAKTNMDGFLRSDTKTRMDAYAVGKPVGAYTTEEIRELEDRPTLTPSERALVDKPPSAAPPAAPATQPATNGNVPAGASSNGR